MELVGVGEMWSSSVHRDEDGAFELRTELGRIYPPFREILFEYGPTACVLVEHRPWCVTDWPGSSSVVLFTHIGCDPTMLPVMSDWSYLASLDDEGRFHGATLLSRYAGSCRPLEDCPEWEFGPLREGYAIMAMYGISLLNCRRQTELIERPDFNPPEKWLRRQKQPKLRYHVLSIDPLKKMLRYDEKADPTGKELAWHLCRGHWKHYTKEKPLFGHYVGSVWCPPHAKGKKENGVVLKEYKVETAGVS